MNRHDRLGDLMERRGLDVVVLRRPANFAWYTGGADTKVDHVAPEGVADLIVGRESPLVLTSTIEAPRMRSEQTQGLEVVEYPWHEDRMAALREVVGDARVGSDLGLPGTVDLSDVVARLRRTLDPDAVESLRAIGAAATAAMAEAAAAVEPGMTEHEAAARLAAACRSRGLTATVLLAAADERIALHRHPVPVGATIERRAMLVASAEGHGLYANLTRIVELDEPRGQTHGSDPFARRQRACDEILARMRDEATRPGRTVAEAFADCRRFYAEAGYPEEWRFHHQGGLTGYASRELIATPATNAVIETGQAFAWNPSIAGAKAEETFVLTETGPELVAGGHPAVV
jgi:Xaa-Pro aminopeptidase